MQLRVWKNKGIKFVFNLKAVLNFSSTTLPILSSIFQNMYNFQIHKEFQSLPYMVQSTILFLFFFYFWICYLLVCLKSSALYVGTDCVQPLTINPTLPFGIFIGQWGQAGCLALCAAMCSSPKMNLVPAVTALQRSEGLYFLSWVRRRSSWDFWRSCSVKENSRWSISRKATVNFPQLLLHPLVFSFCLVLCWGQHLASRTEFSLIKCHLFLCKKCAERKCCLLGAMSGVVDKWSYKSSRRYLNQVTRQLI